MSYFCFIFVLMRAYTNKTDRIDDRKCLYSEINKGNKARKKGARNQNKTEIKNESIY